MSYNLNLHSAQRYQLIPLLRPSAEVGVGKIVGLGSPCHPSSAWEQGASDCSHTELFLIMPPLLTLSSHLREGNGEFS